MCNWGVVNSFVWFIFISIVVAPTLATVTLLCIQLSEPFLKLDLFAQQESVVSNFHTKLRGYIKPQYWSHSFQHSAYMNQQFLMIDTEIHELQLLFYFVFLAVFMLLYIDACQLFDVSVVVDVIYCTTTESRIFQMMKVQHIYFHLQNCMEGLYWSTRNILPHFLQ